MVRSWFKLWRSGVRLGFNELFGMSLRGTLQPDLVEAIILVTDAGLDVPLNQLEAHHLAGGSATSVARAAIVLGETHDPVGVPMLAAVDLGKMPVYDLAQAFAISAKQHPSMRYIDIVSRFKAGEDVLGAAGRGELAPPSAADGWFVRIEQGPFTAPVLRTLLRDGGIPQDAWVKGPGQREWIQARFVEDLGPK